MFVIDQRPYRAAYDSAMAQLERARASVQLAEAQNKRAESLIKTGAISIDTLDTRSAALGQTNADVHAAEAALATAKLNLDFTEVRAPIAGKVSRAVLTLGNLVQADQTVLTSVVSQRREDRAVDEKPGEVQGCVFLRITIEAGRPSQPDSVSIRP